jgi:hypothetical protein
MDAVVSQSSRVPSEIKYPTSRQQERYSFGEEWLAVCWQKVKTFEYQDVLHQGPS